jgi:hypothetical protein
MNTTSNPTKTIYWHRELPPLRARIEGEHQVSARSQATELVLAERDKLWGRCYPSLKSSAIDRINQEIARQHGVCAHVLDESVIEKEDYHNGTFWLEATYVYVLYLDP